MNLVEIKNEIGRKRNNLADASVILNRCKEIIKNVLETSKNERSKSTVNAELKNIEKLYNSYTNSVNHSENGLSGDGLLFATFSNYSYNFVETIEYLE